jgi:hypothetical protein
VTTAGVVGTSGERHGVIGTSSLNVGVFGYSKNNHGVFGVTDSNSPTAFAGIFDGNVFSNGTISAPVKNALVRFPDGSQRVLHCMESPEHWFEDFGSAKLARGRAVVKLDADFAKVIKSGDYRVFVTPEGDCRGLYVRRRTIRFEVRELAGGNPASRFPTASSAAARTSKDTGASPRWTCPCRCQPGRRAHRESPRRRRRDCVRSSPAWRRRRGSGHRRARRNACAHSVQGLISRV